MANHYMNNGITGSTQAYIGDGLARKNATENPRRERRPVTKEEVRVRRNRERSRSMSLRYTAGMVLLVGAVVVLCGRYLSVQNSITSRLSNIASLESQLESAQKENLALKLSIDSYEDYGYIYQEATSRLGMKPADGSQIKYFDLTESEYVKQNESIPQE